MDAGLLLNSPHTCSSISPAEDRAHFCQYCGVFLPLFPQPDPSLPPSPIPSPSIVRSSVFAKRDPHGSNSSFVLSQMIKKQAKNRFFNKQPHHLAYRGKVLAWMESLVTKFNYQQSTLHLAVCYFDAVLSLYTVTVPQVKLISYICLFVAAKMEEKDEKIPLVEEAFKLFDKEFSSAEILNCEKIVFKILDYQLNLKTPFSFASFFLSRGVLLSSEIPPEGDPVFFVAQLETAVVELLRKSLQSYEFYQFTSIAVAAAAIALARKTMGVPEIWPEFLENLTLLRWSAIEECVAMMEGREVVVVPVGTGVGPGADGRAWASPDKGRSTSTCTMENSPCGEEGGANARVSEFGVKEGSPAN